MLIVILFGLLEFAQRKKWVKEQETEPDDLSSIEWAEWKRQQKLEEPLTIDEDGKITV